MTDETPQHFIDELFLRVIGRFKSHVRECADALDLSVLQLIALRHIEEPMPMGHLAQVLFSDPSLVTSVADGLEEKGYLERRVSSEDRRVKELVLTTDGREMKGRVRDLMARGNPVFEALSHEEKATLERLMRKMAGEA